MSQVRVHNFSISLDGCGTGTGITFDAPFGHAGERLHEWMFIPPINKPLLDRGAGVASSCASPPAATMVGTWPRRGSAG